MLRYKISTQMAITNDIPEKNPKSSKAPQLCTHIIHLQFIPTLYIKNLHPETSKMLFYIIHLIEIYFL